MNLIDYTGELNNINLTPFKYVMCSLINKFSYKVNYISSSIDNTLFPPFQTHFLITFEVIDSLINTFKNESSKILLINSIKETMNSFGLSHTLSKEQIDAVTNHFIDSVNENLKEMKMLNSLFSFFLDTLVSLRENKESKENQFLIFDIGGHIDNFLRKCINAFNKSSFSDMISLFESIIRYNNNEIINTKLSSKESDLLFEDCFALQKYYETFNHENFSQKSIFEISSSSKLKDKLFNIHKFYDHNLKYIYNDNSSNETKIHYSLLYLTHLYFECGYYDKAIQILFECVKLSQSNCDHEALLKCFLWLSKIFIQIGNFDLASQCLSTCLIKSFQNNFQLIYLLSSIELANLNFVFESNIGNNSSNSLEEKILSHSNNCLHLYKNISDFYTMKDKEIKNDLSSMINYTNFHMIYNLVRKGEYSLSIEYIKILLQEVSSFDTVYDDTNNEIINNVILLLMNIMEFDINFCLNTIHSIIQRKDVIDNEYVLWLVVKKFCAESECESNVNRIDEHVGIFYKFIDEFYDLYHEFHSNYLIAESTSFIEDKLQMFIKKTKQFHILTYHTKALILLSKVYIKQGRYTEAMIILNKNIVNSNTSNYLMLVAKINLCYCYYYLKYEIKAKELINEIKEKIDNVCSITARYDYYYLINLYEKKDEIAFKCINLGLLLNNKEKVSNAISMIKDIKSQQEMNDKISKVFEENEKLFGILNRFKTSSKDAIQVIYQINKRVTNK